MSHPPVVRFGSCDYAMLSDSPTDVARESGMLSERNQYCYDSMMEGSYMNAKESRNWYGIVGGTDAVNRVINAGWPEGAERLSKLSVAALEAPVSIRRRRSRGAFGDSLDIQRVYKGDLSHAWDRMSLGETSRPPLITVLVDLSSMAFLDAANLFWRGAAALRFSQCLLETGYHVAIIGVTGVENWTRELYSSATLVQFVSIKDSDQPLDMNSLATVVCLAGFKRTRIHAQRAQAAEAIGVTCSSGLGNSTNHTAIERKIREALPHFPSLPQEVHYIPQNVMSQQEAQNWVDAHIRQINKRN